MKKLSILCVLLLAICLMPGSAFAVATWCKDAGANGTFEESVVLFESNTVNMDIYVNDIVTGDHLISSAFVMNLSPSVEIVEAYVYDTSHGGPWDKDMTVIDLPNNFIGMGNLSGTAADVNGDVKLAHIKFHCLAFGDDLLTIDDAPLSNDVVSSDTGYVYDQELVPNNFTFHQVRCCTTDMQCSDGLYCNGPETCTGPDTYNQCPGLTCVRGTAINCNDGVACTADSCNDTTDQCDNIPNNALCDDSVYCTVDVCDEDTGCENTPTASRCNDSNVCTTDSCDVDDDCQYDANSLSCNDTLYCNGTDTCANKTCSIHSGNPCDDANVCTTDQCFEAGDTCSNVCNAASAVDICCDNAACDTPICQAGGAITIGDWWANCGDVGVKIDICLQNLAIPVGGFQMDLCENPVRQCSITSAPCEDDADCVVPTGQTCNIVGADPDCLVCIDCEMTERTVMFDCAVNELSNGCCRVILFSKHPGGVINPGECNVVRIVYEFSDDPECCNTCIEIDGTGIVLVDQYGYDVLGVMADGGSVCPFVCGDIEPANTRHCSIAGTACEDATDCPTPQTCIMDTTWNCGDGDVDIFDILMEVDFALDIINPDACQGPEPNLGPRDDVPTGTPPYCKAPDKQINILDIMVLIDMALNRQDCCSYYYSGKIY